LPAQNIREELGSRWLRGGFGRLGCRGPGRRFGRLVTAQLRLDVAVGVRLAAAPASSRAAARSPGGRLRLIANAFANGLGLLQNVIEEVTDIAGHAVDDRKDLLEDVAHQVRGGDPEIFCELPDVIRELLGDARVEDPLLPSVAPRPGAAPL
jgi:hypothetical protein